VRKGGRWRAERALHELHVSARPWLAETWEQPVDADLRGVPVRYRTRTEHPHTFRRGNSARYSGKGAKPAFVKTYARLEELKDTAKRLSIVSIKSSTHETSCAESILVVALWVQAH
jgi:hypothetical protein